MCRRSLIAFLASAVALGVAGLRSGSDGANAPILAMRAAGAAGVGGPKGPTRGDAFLKGQIELSKARLQGKTYEVELGSGKKAILTLDPDLQAAAERVVRQAKAPVAAIVVMKTDGTLLAVAGGRESRSDDPSLALSVWAPAASVFKVVTAAALLKAGVGADKKVCYHGGFRSVEASNLQDQPRLDTTCNDLGYAIAKSQNALIAKLAHTKLHPSSLARMAQSFGFGSTPDFALNAEVGTITPPEEGLEFARFAAGFWNSNLSALGGALLANVPASGGMLVTPQIVAEVTDSGSRKKIAAARGQRVVDKGTARTLMKMMEGTVRYGTAAQAFRDRRGRPYLKGVEVAGKTGSLSQKSPEFVGYSWFVGAVPADKPEMVISVVLGNPESWWLKGHTAARLVLEAHY